MREPEDEAAAVWLDIVQAVHPAADTGERLRSMWTQDRRLLELKEQSIASPLETAKVSDFDRLMLG